MDISTILNSTETITSKVDKLTALRDEINDQDIKDKIKKFTDYYHSFMTGSFNIKDGYTYAYKVAIKEGNEYKTLAYYSILSVAMKEASIRKKKCLIEKVQILTNVPYETKKESIKIIYNEDFSALEIIDSEGKDILKTYAKNIGLIV